MQCGKSGCFAPATWSMTEFDEDGAYGFTYESCSTHLGHMADVAMKGSPNNAKIEWLRLERVES